MEFPQEPQSATPECLGRDEQCPLCGGDNQCRVAKGHLYKGPCWCHDIVVPAHVLKRLLEDQLNPACLCRPCLEKVAAELIPPPTPPLAPEDFYLDENGITVFTAAYHLKRGNCCDNGCRHCPY